MNTNTRVSNGVVAMILSSALGMVVGCTPAPSSHDVAYYRSHADERKAKIAECANDPGALRNDALCINARKAQSLEGIGGLRRMPPMGLAEAEEKAREEQRKANQRR